MVVWKDAPITSPFILGHDWPATLKSALHLPPLNKYLLMIYPYRIWNGFDRFLTTYMHGASPDRNSILQEMGGL